MEWKDFLDLIDRHDLTYEYSDDARKYRQGAASMSLIRQAALTFSTGRVQKVWDEMCDRKSPANGSMFYWRN